MRIVEPSFTLLDNLDCASLATRIEYCGRICYRSEGNISEASAEPFVRNMLQKGHLSVLEMAVLTLEVEGLSAEQTANFYACEPRFLKISRAAADKMLLTASVRAWREFLQQGRELVLSQALLHFFAQIEPIFFSDIQTLAPSAPQEGIRLRRLSLAEVEKLPVHMLALHRFLGVRFVVNRAVSHELVRHRPCSFLQESQRYCRYNSERFGGEVAFIRPLFYAEGSPELALWQETMAFAEKKYLQLLKTSSPQAARTVLPNSCKTELILYTNLAQWRHILALRATPAADPSMREVMTPLWRALASRYPALF